MALGRGNTKMMVTAELPVLSTNARGEVQPTPRPSHILFHTTLFINDPCKRMLSISVASSVTVGPPILTSCDPCNGLQASLAQTRLAQRQVPTAIP